MPRRHGDERRTLIQEEKRAVAEIKVVDEPVTVVVSLEGLGAGLKGPRGSTPRRSQFKPAMACAACSLPQRRRAAGLRQGRPCLFGGRELAARRTRDGVPSRR